MTSSSPVLVLGQGIGAFLQVIRSLGRRSFHVDVNEGASLAMRSRYIRDRILFPKYAPAAPEEWLDHMEKLIVKKNYDFIIPCSDDEVYPFIRHRGRLEAIGPEIARSIAIVSDHAFEICTDKYQSAKLAAESGLPVPEFYELAIENDLADFVKSHSWEYPFIVKPKKSYIPGNSRFTVRRIRSEGELFAFVNSCHTWDRCMIQRNFNGIGVGIYLLAKNGKILFDMAQERLHEPLEGGGGYYRRTVDVPDELRSGVEKTVKALNYTGVAMFEFKRNRDGQWAFIEINSRFWGSLALSIAAGADFPYWLYLIQKKGVEDFPQRYRRNICARNLYADSHWIMDNLRAESRDETLATKPLSAVLAEFRYLISGREYWDSFAWRDPGPFFGEAGMLASECLNKMRKKILPRWKGKYLSKKNMLEHFATVQNLLVICYGNICRSPFAAGYLREKLAGKIEVREGGYHPKTGRSAPSIAKEAAASLGIDLSEHHSRIFTDEDLNWADFIVCFDEENYDELRRRLNGNTEKIWPLGTLLSERFPWIDDPYGSDIDGFLHTYQTIRACCDRLISSHR